MPVELLYRDEVYALVGAFMEVHSQLGPGFYEAVYQEASEIELGLRRIPFQAQVQLPICYKGHQLKKFYIADLVCYGKIVVEIKAMDVLSSNEESQLLNDLKATGFEVGLLVNFGSRGKLEWRRYARSQPLSS